MISLFSDYDHGLNNFCQEEQEDELRQRGGKCLFKKLIKIFPYKHGLCNIHYHENVSA